MGAISETATKFMALKGKRGRKVGWNKTTKKDNRKIFKTFKRLRPPGHYVDSRIVHQGLPRRIKQAICRRTIRRRLAKKGFHPKKKIAKTDPGPALANRRVLWAKKFEDWTPANWKANLQGVGDFKEFTWYPKLLQPKFKQLRASWTYMSKQERLKPAFVRPKRWFPRAQYKKTKKQKVFGLTSSKGGILAFFVPTPLTAIVWARFVRQRLGPFLKAEFPQRTSFQILLDGENLLHAPEAKAAMAEHGIKVLPDWPKYSPELNPQENVWAWVEPDLRRTEKDDETFDEFQGNLLATCKRYPASEKLVGSMAKRIRKVIDSQGAMIDQ